MVHGREKDGKAEQFGVSGYTHKNTFLMFDRETDSLWYPFGDGKWTAISGPRKGETIPFMEKPAPLTLGEWRKKHPNTLVLLGDKRRVRSLDILRKRTGPPRP